MGDNNENLPVHWDREILFDMRDDSSTEGSSDDEEILLSDDEDVQSPEEKDHLVAELYKHMEDKGTPINKTPSIGDKDVDLYKLFRLVQKLRGQQQVTNNNQWRTVAKKLGFETNWCVNQVRVCYKRYLHSFEELYRALGCTLVNHPRGNLSRIRHGSGRPLARGVRVKSRDEDDRREKDDEDNQRRSAGSSGGDKEEEEQQQPKQRQRGRGGQEEDSSDQSSISSQDSENKEKQESETKEEEEVETSTSCASPSTPNLPKKDGRGRKKGVKKVVKKEEELQVKEELENETEVVGRKRPKKNVKERSGSNVFTRPRRDSSSSLSTASEVTKVVKKVEKKKEDRRFKEYREREKELREKEKEREREKEKEKEKEK